MDLQHVGRQRYDFKGIAHQHDKTVATIPRNGAAGLWLRFAIGVRLLSVAKVRLQVRTGRGTCRLNGLECRGQLCNNAVSLKKKMEGRVDIRRELDEKTWHKVKKGTARRFVTRFNLDCVRWTTGGGVYATPLGWRTSPLPASSPTLSSRFVGKPACLKAKQPPPWTRAVCCLCLAIRAGLILVPGSLN